MTTTLADADLRALAKLDACTLANAIETFDSYVHMSKSACRSRSAAS